MDNWQALSVEVLANSDGVADVHCEVLVCSWHSWMGFEPFEHGAGRDFNLQICT
jgi:hypothetical protein